MGVEQRGAIERGEVGRRAHDLLEERFGRLDRAPGRSERGEARGQDDPAQRLVNVLAQLERLSQAGAGRERLHAAEVERGQSIEQLDLFDRVRREVVTGEIQRRSALPDRLFPATEPLGALQQPERRAERFLAVPPTRLARDARRRVRPVELVAALTTVTHRGDRPLNAALSDPAQAAVQ